MLKNLMLRKAEQKQRSEQGRRTALCQSCHYHDKVATGGFGRLGILHLHPQDFVLFPTHCHVPLQQNYAAFLCQPTAALNKPPVS